MVHRRQLCLGNGGAGDCGVPGDSGVQEMVVLIDSGAPGDAGMQGYATPGDGGDQETVVL